MNEVITTFCPKDIESPPTNENELRRRMIGNARMHSHLEVAEFLLTDQKDTIVTLESAAGKNRVTLSIPKTATLDRYPNLDTLIFYHSHPGNRLEPSHPDNIAVEKLANEVQAYALHRLLRYPSPDEVTLLFYSYIVNSVGKVSRIGREIAVRKISLTMHTPRPYMLSSAKETVIVPSLYR